jgi:hypothetical protein
MIVPTIRWAVYDAETGIATQIIECDMGPPTVDMSVPVKIVRPEVQVGDVVATPVLLPPSSG